MNAHLLEFMNKHFINQSMLFAALYIITPMLLAQDNFDDFLREPIKGEQRPSWWYDAWFKNGLIISGVIHESNIVDEIVEIKNSNGDIIKKYLVSECKLTIKKVLTLGSDSDAINSEQFVPDSIVVIYKISEFRMLSGRTHSLAKFNQGIESVVCLSTMGLLKAGNYYIKWVKDKEFEQIITRIVDRKQNKEMERQ